MIKELFLTRTKFETKGLGAVYIPLLQYWSCSCRKMPHNFWRTSVFPCQSPSPRLHHSEGSGQTCFLGRNSPWGWWCGSIQTNQPRINDQFIINLNLMLLTYCLIHTKYVYVGKCFTQKMTRTMAYFIHSISGVCSLKILCVTILLLFL